MEARHQPVGLGLDGRCHGIQGLEQEQKDWSWIGRRLAQHRHKAH